MSDFPFKAISHPKRDKKVEMFSLLKSLKMITHARRVYLKNIGKEYKADIIVIHGNEYESYDVLPELIQSVEESRLHVCKTYINGKRVPLISIMDIWNNNKYEILKKAGINASPHVVRETVYNLYRNYEATEFKTGLAAMIYEEYKPKVVLDPCMGRGSRMIAAMAKGIEYHGVDPSQWTSRITDDIIDEFHTSDIPLPISYVEPFEDFVIDRLEGRVDMVFTSPPYDDYEVYEKDNPDQLINRYKTREERIEIMYLWMDKIYTVLKSSGLVVLSINDPPCGEHIVENLIKYCEKIGFTLERVIATAHLSDKDRYYGRYIPAKAYTGLNLYNYQPIFVLRK